MRWSLIAVLALAIAAWAANVKLYLASGDYQLVREYQVLSDRVRYYSVERSQWEEIPLNLVDLKRTEAEAAARQADLSKEAKIAAEEAAAESEVQSEASHIPQDPGVYWTSGQETKVLQEAESTIHTNKGLNILKRLSPAPAPETDTLELKGAHSSNVFSDPGQEFYIHLSQLEQFGIVRLTAKGPARIVEEITVEAVTKQIVEEPVLVPIVQREVAENLYHIAPKIGFSPGEYAVVEFTPGQENMQVWDFAIQPKRQ